MAYASVGASGVYEIFNTINGKRYIGSAVVLLRRFTEHRKALTLNRHINSKLQRAWNKYGEQAFVFRILESCQPGECVLLEQQYLDAHAPCYNIAKLAGSNLGVKRTAEQIAKTVSEETRAKLSAAHSGRKLSDETKTAMSLARIGKPLSEAHKQSVRDGWARRKAARSIST